jgi:hypothetical protein
MRRAAISRAVPGLRYPWAAYRLLTARNSYLKCTGWIRTLGTFVAEDASGHPIPWMSYPAIDFIEARLTKSMRLFEYGSGYSTLWFAARVGSVDCVEHNPDWSRAIQSRLPSNARVSQRMGDDYVSASSHSPPYDVVVIDGIERVACALASVQNLSPGGVFIWDDADRGTYEPGMKALRDRGFRRIDFRGLAAINAAPKTTAVLYRPDNVFEI